MGKIVELSEDSFQREVLQAELPVLVDFYAPWCGPCKMIAPLLEQLAAEFQGKIKFTKLNVDEAPNLAGNYEISGVPTLVIFRGGKLADRMVGFRGTNAFKSWLQGAAAEPSRI